MPAPTQTREPTPDSPPPLPRLNRDTVTHRVRRLAREQGQRAARRELSRWLFVAACGLLIAAALSDSPIFLIVSLLVLLFVMPLLAASTLTAEVQAEDLATHTPDDPDEEEEIL